MSKDAYYFSHDSNARTDIKIANMIYDYGMSGYGMYWVIVEVLRESEEYKILNDKKTCRALAMQMHSKVDEVQKFINDCIEEYQLFDTDGEFLWSNSLLRRMDKLENVRQKRKEAANKRWNNKAKEEKQSENDANAYENDANALQVDSKSNAKGMQVDTNAMQLDAKESKVKESKVKESKIYIEIDYAENVKITQDQYQKLKDEYDLNYIKFKIMSLDEYIIEKPDKYKDHYKVLLKWIAKDGDNAKKKNDGVKDTNVPWKTSMPERL